MSQTTAQIYGVIAIATMTVDGNSVAAGTVVNQILWDGVTPWTPPIGTQAVADPTNTMAIGTTQPVPA